MKILWKGQIFNPTGIATANREMIKALHKLGVKIQVTDPFRSDFENKGLEHFNNPIDVKDANTIFSDYPQTWSDGFGKLIGHPIHEGTRLIPGWSQLINRMEKIFVCSEANKNLYKWNDVVIPIEVIHYGTNPELYKPAEQSGERPFTFLSVNSWTGKKGDRKGTDLLIKAFDEEFKEGEAELILKIGTFWQNKVDFAERVADILGHENPDIIINSEFVKEQVLVDDYYQKADCFVAPTRGEGFGMTILNAMACGLPVVVTKDVNSGHMDFCKNKDSVVWIDAPEVEQGDLQFYAPGNMLAVPDFDSIKKGMRYAFENKEDLSKKALVVSHIIRENWTWEKTGEKIIKFLEEKE